MEKKFYEVSRLILSKGCQDSEVNEKKPQLSFKQELKTWGGGGGCLRIKVAGKAQEIQGWKTF